MKKKIPAEYIGIWAKWHEDYLVKNKPEVYNHLVKSNSLQDYLQGIQSAYAEYAHKKTVQLEKRYGISHDLQERNFEEWLLRSYEVQNIVQEELRAKLCPVISQNIQNG